MFPLNWVEVKQRNTLYSEGSSRWITQPKISSANFSHHQPFVVYTNAYNQKETTFWTTELFCFSGLVLLWVKTGFRQYSIGPTYLRPYQKNITIFQVCRMEHDAVYFIRSPKSTWNTRKTLDYSWSIQVIKWVALLKNAFFYLHSRLLTPFLVTITLKFISSDRDYYNNGCQMFHSSNLSEAAKGCSGTNKRKKLIEKKREFQVHLPAFTTREWKIRQILWGYANVGLIYHRVLWEREERRNRG